jgi:thiamine biosynthesis lipoprotein ApbE
MSDPRNDSSGASGGARFLLLTALVLFVAPSGPAAADGSQEFRSHRDGILGTSLDITVVAATRSQADAVEKAVLDEIERCRLILSTYDPNSEICRLASAGGPVKASPDLLEVLEACDRWRTHSGGAFNAHLGELIALWKQAEKDNKPPEPAKLAATVRRVSEPAWRLDKSAGTVTLLSAAGVNIDSLGKGYVIDKALAAGRAKDPTIAGLLVDVGGDLRVWGSPGVGGPAWVIGVSDPKHSQENAPLLTRIKLADRAAATSGNYERYYTIGGKRYSHIFDPRTGLPVDHVVSATVVAMDSASANALATSLCVLQPGAGLNLVRTVPGAQCLIVGADGKQYASEGWKFLEISGAAATGPAGGTASTQPSTAWPKGHQLTVSLTVPKLRKRPYIAVWVEDSKGSPVRTLTVWGNERKYLKDLRSWWSFAKSDATLVKSTTRATRSAGKYELVWDGLDDKGRPVPPGAYTIQIETAREDGPHTRLQDKIECGASKASGKMTPNREVAEVLMNYGPAGSGS